MKAYKCSEEDLKQALIRVNKSYSENIAFFSLEKRKYYINFRLKVRDNCGPGHSIGFYKVRNKFGNERYINLSAACWHVHGDFFDALFKINPNAVIYSGYSLQKKITKDYGNWKDTQRGSRMFPRMFSEMCYCGKE